MNCIKCGKDIPDGARFCNFCGARQELICAGCGAVLPDGSAFCHMCGTPVKSPPKAEPAAQGPAPEEPEPADGQKSLPNKQNFDELFWVVGSTSQARNDSEGKWSFRVPLRYKNIGDDDDIDIGMAPDFFCYSRFTIVKKSEYPYISGDDYGTYIDTDGTCFDRGPAGRAHGKPAFPGLEDLTAYALSDRGLYYATRDGKICFLDSEDGSTQVLGTQEKVIDLKYDAGVLIVICVKNRRQTGYSEHCYDDCFCRDVWEDIYELDMGVLTIQHPGWFSF